MQMICWNTGIKLLMHLKMVLFHLNIDDAAHDHVFEDVANFIHEIESIAEKIHLGLFEDFFESSSPANYAKTLINTKNLNENKEILAEIKDRISNLKDRIKEMSETE